MILWLEVTRDKYELPVKVCDSAAMLAKMCGVKTHSIRTNVHKFENGYIQSSRYRRVVIEEGEEET